MLALLPILLSLAPSLAEWLSGPKAAAVATQAVSVVQAVTGTSDPDTVANLPPDKRAELQIKLAQIAVEMRKTENEDLIRASSMSVQSKLIAGAQVTGGAIVLAVWGYMVLRMATYGLPTGSSEFYATVLAGVSGILGGIIQFFYGNSTASNAANQRLDQLARQAPALAPQVPLLLPPPAIATTAPVTVNQASPAGTTTDDLNAASLAQARAG